jgi:hypothetical protein
VSSNRSGLGEARHRWSAPSLLLALVVLVFLWAMAGTARASCVNEAMRIGASANLPECRAYELVTPTVGVGAEQLGPVLGGQGTNTSLADTWFTSPDGNSVIFDTTGSVQGEEANGKHDLYESTRGVDGWVTRSIGPPGAEVPNAVYVGGSSSDHSYTFWKLTPSRELFLAGQALAGQADSYLRARDGQQTPLGIGSLGVDPYAEGVLLTENGGHVIFFTESFVQSRPGQADVQLEPDAPPSPIAAIYDRSAQGATHVVSLLPGDITPTADAYYLGGSPDGSAVVFEINGAMYVRRGDAVTSVVAYPEPGSTLQCKTPNDVGTSRSELWLRNGTPIPGASTGEYTVQAADVGTALQCEVTVEGSTVAASVPAALVTTSSSPISPPQLRAPVPAPEPFAPTSGTMETCATGEWVGSASFSFQWYANGVPIVGATSASYTLQPGDVPAVLQCAVTASNGQGAIVAFSAATETSPAPPAPAPVPIVDIRGNILGVAGGVASVATFAGASPGGGRVFYAGASNRNNERQPYEAFSMVEPGTGARTTIADQGSIWPVQVSEDGSHAYFISTAVLSGNANSYGEEAVAGKPNLYVWDGTVRFIATVAPEDIAGRDGTTGSDSVLYGLGMWVAGLNPLNGGAYGPAIDPARSTPDGRFLVFQTRANLAPGYEAQGHSEIYRLDDETGSLTCISCNPAGTPATADAELESFSSNVTESAFRATDTYSHVPNITPDGAFVLFETKEALLAADRNSAYDVYGWREGSLGLISSGQGAHDSFLYGMSADARDVVFATYDSLVSQDQDGGGRSLYDARIGGGFLPAPSARGCLESSEECQPPALAQLSFASQSTSSAPSSGNVHSSPTPSSGSGKVQSSHKPKQKPKQQKHKKKQKHRKSKARGGSRGGRS